MKSHSVSAQERDNAAGAFAADQAIVTSCQADVARLEELQSYEKVYAPFDGVITARNTDVGELINAGAGTRNSELFRVPATDTLRIYVAVPEVYAPQIHVGAKPNVTLDEYPGQAFQGTLVRTDKAINQLSRTFLAEVDVDNAAARSCPAPTRSCTSRCARTRAVSPFRPTRSVPQRGPRVGVVRDGKARIGSGHYRP